MATVAVGSEDPLVAALPPVTDYITYLTLLEYQLTPKNLPTLNRLLSEDDGTLAAEIGWDLLKLVLPMLQVVPDDANKCLTIIARRGNPREVIVRVAEELERLGADDIESEEEGEDVHELPTFAGEAPRVHLGDLTLDGMPPTKSTKVDHKETGDVHAQSGSDDGLSLKALFSMLGMLHPRIKTQYPSRFLATSLPAALKAYRNLHITEETTTAFIDFLTKLSGKQRPALPPRISTAGTTSKITLSQTQNVDTTAPLPDPEASSETTGSKTSPISPSDDQAIIQKLLQAIALEVLDEYTNAFQSSDPAHMEWTVRAREGHEPKRVVPGRRTEQQRWYEESELISRDETVTKFVKLCNNLNLDIIQALNNWNDSKPVNDAEEDEDSERDYPTSPNDIPFPRSGLLILCAAEQFYQTRPAATTSSSSSAPSLSMILLSLQKIGISVDLHLATADALLSLLYVSLMSSTSSSTTLPQSTVIASLRALSNLFVTSIDASIRDSSYNIAYKLLHDHADQDTTVSYIKNLLSSSPHQASPIFQIQAGNVKAIATDWLKNEILTGKITPTIISTDPDIQSSIFPLLPSVPSPFTSSHPVSTQITTEQDLEDFLLHIPAYVSALNLICILAAIEHQNPYQHPSSNAEADDQKATEADETHSAFSGPLLHRSKQFLEILEGWKDSLLALVTAAKRGTGPSSSGINDGPMNLTDLYALDDACQRAKIAIEGVDD